MLTDEQYAQFEKKKQAGRNQPPRRERRIFGRGRDDDERRRRQLERFFKNVMNVEGAWTLLMVSIEDAPQSNRDVAEVAKTLGTADMKKIFRDAFDKREKLMREAMSFDDPREQMQEMFMKVMEADATFAGKLHEFFNDEQSAKFDEWRSNQNPWMRRRGGGRDRSERTPRPPAEPIVFSKRFFIID